MADKPESEPLTTVMGGKRLFLNRVRVKSFSRRMAPTSHLLNDNQVPTYAELETSNRELRASLRRCENLVADCKDKLAAAYGLASPEENAEP